MGTVSHAENDGVWGGGHVGRAVGGRPPATRGMVPLLCLVCGLSACTVGPDFQRPQADLREQWSETGDARVATQTAVDAQWWKAFNDPALDELIRRAYRQNLPLQIAGLRIVEARAQLGIARDLQYPQTQELFASVAGMGLSDNAVNVRGLERSYFDYQVGFDAVWELDFWGRFRRNVEAAEAGWTASVADYDEVLVSLTAEVARTYTLIRTFEVLIDLAVGNVQVQEEGLKMAESRFRNGATTKLDVTQARTLLESTRATIPELQTRLRQAQNATSTLLGRPPGGIQGLLEGPRAIPAAPREAAVGVPAELLRRRPDIRSAELNAAVQGARIGIAQANLYPSLSLFGEIGFQTASGTRGGSNCTNIFDGDSLFYSYGPQVRWPILNYGRLKNNVRVQDARFQQLLVNFQDTVLNAA